MRLLILLLAFSSCGTVIPSTNCNILLAGDYDDRLAYSYLTPQIVDAAIAATIDGASLTTDPDLIDQTDNCKAMQGYRIYTKNASSWLSPQHNNNRISGFTSCAFKIIVVNTPQDGKWWNSSIIHELFHVMQRCDARQPVDHGSNADHANWLRDGIYTAIDKQREMRNK